MSIFSLFFFPVLSIVLVFFLFSSLLSFFISSLFFQQVQFNQNSLLEFQQRKQGRRRKKDEKRSRKKEEQEKEKKKQLRRIFGKVYWGGGGSVCQTSPHKIRDPEKHFHFYVIFSLLWLVGLDRKSRISLGNVAFEVASQMDVLYASGAFRERGVPASASEKYS